MTLVPGGARFMPDVEAIARFYPVAAEGTLQPDGPYRWKFIPSREYRGPRQTSYRIELSSDCSIEPRQMSALIGKPVFLLLSGGPDVYEASRCVNLQPIAVEDAIRAEISLRCKPR